MQPPWSAPGRKAWTGFTSSSSPTSSPEGPTSSSSATLRGARGKTSASRTAAACGRRGGRELCSRRSRTALLPSIRDGKRWGNDPALHSLVDRFRHEAVPTGWVGFSLSDLAAPEIVIGALAALVLVLITLVNRYRWRALRPKLFSKTPEVLALEKPGLLAVHLDGDRWQQTSRTVLEKVRQSLDGCDNDIAREASAAMGKVLTADDRLATLTRQAAARAVQTGSLQSVLLKVQEQLVYVLVFPARHEHSGLFRRYEPFMDGWVDHVARLRRELGDKERQESLLCLLYFLSPAGRDGVLLAAYEGDVKRVVPGNLAPEVGADDDHTLRLADKYEFQLA